MVKKTAKGAEYKVGYGKLPKSGQFVKGRSGNPGGRPPKSRNFVTDLREELDETVLVKEGGKERKLSKQRAFFKALMAKAMQGNVGAIRTALEMMARYFQIPESEDTPLSQTDQDILDAFLSRQTPVSAPQPVRKKTGGK